MLDSRPPDDVRPRLFDVEPWPLARGDHIAVMMPFDRDFDAVYEAIQRACAPWKTLRVDEVYGPRKIINDIFSAIERSRLVVCDLSERNPNVLYEVGLAHARNRDVVMLTQSAEDVPFDLRHIRFIRYLNNEQGLASLTKSLRSTVLECVTP